MLENQKNSTELVKRALTVALIMVFFTVFRGFANLLNAFLVPMALYMGLKGANRVQSLTLSGATLICGLLFFSVQVFFILLYSVMAWQLRQLMKRGASVTRSGVTLSGLAAIGFYAAIRLTDMVFLTRMHTLYMGLLNGNWFLYALMLLAEGLIVGFGLAFGAAAIERRIRTV